MAVFSNESSLWDFLELLVYLLLAGVTAVSAWVTAVLMRRRMKRALGRQPSDAELVSLTTWMRVDEAEREGSVTAVVSDEALKQSRAIQDTADDPTREL